MKKTSIFLLFIITALMLAACSGNVSEAQNGTMDNVNQTGQVETQEPLNGSQSQENQLSNQVENSMDASANQPAADQAAGTPMPVDFATFFPTEYENALSPRNQLAIGTFKLEETSYRITAEQSKVLVPLWQAILALESNPASAAQELSAVQNQVMRTLTAEQLNAILDMQLNNEDLLAVYNQLGLTIQVSEDGTTVGIGRGGGSGGGAGQDSAAREATRTAAQALGTPVGTGAGQGQENKNQLTQAVIDYLSELEGINSQ
jgi:hypothetical protein